MKYVVDAKLSSAGGVVMLPATPDWMYRTAHHQSSTGHSVTKLEVI